MEDPGDAHDYTKDLERKLNIAVGALQEIAKPDREVRDLWPHCTGGVVITIKRADNGWIMESDANMQVFQEGDDEKTAAEAFRGLLYAIHSAIGPDDSRYSKHRIYIDIRPGDKSC